MGVYFLFGDVGDDAAKPPAYIGEAENCLQRIQGHHERKDFWTEEESTEEQTKLYCRGNGAEATGEYTEDGLVVFEGSTARLDTTESVPDTVELRRRSLQEDGVLEQEDDKLVFQENHPFNSPSAAAGVVLGRSSNGWYQWEDADGQHLDELERQ